MRRALAIIAVIVWLGSCASASEAPFELEVAPEFVQGVIPGERLVLLATVTEEGEATGPVELSVSAQGGQVAVEPESISMGEMAEVTFIADPVAGEQELPFTVEVSAVRGSIEQQSQVASVVVPWEDTIAGTARDILAVFTEWLPANDPDLGVGPDTEFDGTVVAPQLLVVTHYAFFSDEWEVGLAWHIMVAPQDWAEIYFRPRDELAPTRAFQLDSWSTALGGERFEIREIPPPPEVVR
jgi:hypothetical protein